MNHRERVLSALNHEEPDRIPIDLGGTLATSINIGAYEKLKSYLKLDTPSEILSLRSMIARVEEEILLRYDVDTRSLPMLGNSRPSERLPDGSYRDEWGVVRRITEDCIPAVLSSPITDITQHADYEFPDPAADHRFETLAKAQEQLPGTALIWITHDLTVVAGLADRICVMYAGRDVEQGTVDEVLDRPLHPYTHGLIGSVPSRNRRGQVLHQIPGMTPSLLNLPPGCAFRTRCERASEECRHEPPVDEHGPGRRVRCFRPYGDVVPSRAHSDPAVAR